MFKRFWWVFLAMIPVGLIAGLFVAAVVTYVMPKQYQSEAVIELKPLPGDSASSMTPQFFGNEFEKIKSRNSLGKVVDHLELVEKWALDKEAAIRILKGIVNTQNIRGTDLISIRVRHTDKEDARDIAAEVARAYVSYRSEILGPSYDKELFELKKAVGLQEDKVEEGRKILTAIVRNGGNIHKGTDSADAQADTPVDAQQFAKAKRDFETDRQLLQSLKLKQINNAIAAKMANDSIVVHEEPQIPQSPVSPNVSLNLILGTALGFLLSFPLSLLVILLSNRLIPAKALV